MAATTLFSNYTDDQKRNAYARRGTDSPTNMAALQNLSQQTPKYNKAEMFHMEAINPTGNMADLYRENTKLPTTQSSSVLDKNNWPTGTVAYKSTSGGGGIGGISAFAPSAAYTQAMDYTNQLLAQLSSGRTSYTDKINELMDQISNREKFSYDADTDPMFQQYLANSMASGQKAMQNTIGQASALTGGYGSTYATAAANGAYNDYVQDAYNNLPEYYNMALEAYQNEGNELYSKLGMYNTADQTEYDRLATAYSANLSNADRIWNQEYSNYWDTANYNQSAAKFNASLANDTAAYYQNLANSKAASANASAESTVSYKDPSETQMKKALEAYNSGGVDALAKYADSLPSDINIEALSSYAQSYGELPYALRDYKQTNNGGVNWFGGLDNNARVSDGTNEYRLDELKKLLMDQGMSSAEANAFLKKYN